MDQAEALAGWGCPKAVGFALLHVVGVLPRGWAPQPGRQGAAGLMCGLADKLCPGRPKERGAARATRMAPAKGSCGVCQLWGWGTGEPQRWWASILESGRDHQAHLQAGIQPAGQGRRGVIVLRQMSLLRW